MQLNPEIMQLAPGTLSVVIEGVKVSIAQQSARRDFVDLYVILRQMPFSAVAARAVQRYGAGLI